MTGRNGSLNSNDFRTRMLNKRNTQQHSTQPTQRKELHFLLNEGSNTIDATSENMDDEFNQEVADDDSFFADQLVTVDVATGKKVSK